MLGSEEESELTISIPGLSAIVFIMRSITELFPSKSAIAIFAAYMTFCVGQGILITASRTDGTGYEYNTVAAVLLTEFVKLILAVICYLREQNHNLTSMLADVKKDSKVCLLYLVPSFLYCIYNNLAFVNLAAFDPTTYYLLLQLRVVVTGIIFQIVFSRKLSGWQWFSLLLLTSGCMLQQLNWNHFAGDSPVRKELPFKLSFNLILIILQTACSCFAGVYNEYLLKGEGGNVNIFIQNIFMYVDSILWNVLVLLEQGDLLSILSGPSLTSLMRPLVVVLIMNNALIGITTSLFLKNLNSILKTFASALELVFTAILSFLLFKVPILPNTWAAIAVVSYAVYLYTKHPVINKPVTVSDSDRKPQPV